MSESKQNEVRALSRQDRRRLARELEKRQKKQGMQKRRKRCEFNGKSMFQSVQEEREGREEMVFEQFKVIRASLPILLKEFSKIKDYRNPKTVTHKCTVLLLFGMLMFVFNMTSRRQANREMTAPVFIENLKRLIPELEFVPHNDTLNRLLSEIDVGKIEETRIELFKKFLRDKKFARYVTGHKLIIAIDGTEKFSRNYCWSEECLERRVNGEDEDKRNYYVYVLEACVVFENGMTIPLMSEFLEYQEGDSVESKQDCELKAFYRLAERLKSHFPRTPIELLLDGLYANGPVMSLCKRYNWDYMIVLKGESLPSVWEEVEGLSKLSDGSNQARQVWGDRQQEFEWINDIEYCYGPRRKSEKVHVALCRETWEELDTDKNEIVQRSSRYAWISNKPFNRRNVHKRCNLRGRYRWKIENNILVEKHHGYEYEHCFSTNWNAMKGYHYLMGLGHMINVLAHHTMYLFDVVKKIGNSELIHQIYVTLSGEWSFFERLKERLNKRYQIRMT